MGWKAGVSSTHREERRPVQWTLGEAGRCMILREGQSDHVPCCLAPGAKCQGMRRWCCSLLWFGKDAKSTNYAKEVLCLSLMPF